MKPLRISLAVLASAQLVLFASPASAQRRATPRDVDPLANTAIDNNDSDDTTEDAAAPADGMIKVNIDSPVSVNLERREAEGSPWEFVCESPCNQRLSPAPEYRIVGSGLNDSKVFKLDATAGRKVKLDVAPGDQKKSGRGLWVLAGSGVLAVSGAVVILAGSDGGATFSQDGITNNSNTNFIFAGTALIVAGVCGGILGSAWYLDNRRTGVDGGRVIPESTPVKLPITNTTTSTRQPIFNAPKTAGVPAVMSVPIFQGSF